MLVGDIYGKDYARVGLKASTIASSCGKIHRQDTAFQPADLAKRWVRRGCERSVTEQSLLHFKRSLLYMISNTIAQIAYLNAKLYGVRRIYFAGTYIRGHPLTMSTLSYAIRFWSKGDMCALFLRHEGYLGAMGAFLKGMAVDDDDGSFGRQMQMT